MILQRLRLRNFLCYGSTDAVLDLRGIRLACLSGNNGHGKSALLDALTWALWGKSRARNDEELIHLGRAEMEVECEFVLGEQHYRVIRKRGIKSSGKRLTSTGALEFQLLGASGYRSISGSTATETQRAITDVLRMDYETFINSAFLMQNRADEFTVKAPGERKRVLADILGLQVYDRLEEKAREAAKGKEAEGRDAALSLREMATELARRPEYEAQLLDIQARLTVLEGVVGEEEARLVRGRDALRELQVKRSQLIEKRERVLDLSRQLDSSRAELQGAERQAQADREVKASASAIRDGWARLQVVRGELDAVGKKAGRLLALQTRGHQLRSAIQASGEALARQREGILGRIKEQERSAAQEEPIRAERGIVYEELAKLVDLESQVALVRHGIATERGVLDAMGQRQAECREKGRELKDRVSRLSAAGAACPLCERSLEEDERSAIIGRLRAEGVSVNRDFRESSSRLTESQDEVVRGETRLLQLEAATRKRIQLQQRLESLDHRLREASEGRETARTLQLESNRLGLLMEKGQYATDERQALAETEAEMALLAYDRDSHAKLEAEAATLAPYATSWAQLGAAEARSAAIAERIDALRRNCAELGARKDAEAQAVEKLSAETAGLASIEAEVKSAEGRLAEARHRAQSLREGLGKALQMIAYCDYLAAQRQEKLQVQEQATALKSLYDELTLAFGKNGIQAMIIDGAIPEIEEEANKLLSRMTENSMRVTLETQREAKTKGGVIETLDVKISDELGQRNYELYSGGEAFRANFAIRIALSKLLARRAGARLQTLVIDEGFGTQDAQGRDKLVECISSISDDFERIVVVTHIDALKDAFPVRIDITKTEEGSRIFLSE